MRRILTLNACSSCSAIGNTFFVASLALALLLTIENGSSFSFYTPVRKSRPVCWWNPDVAACRQSRRNERPIRHPTSSKELLHATPIKSASTGFASSPEDNSREEELQSAYESWRQEYGRDFSPERYQNFRINYMKLTAANSAELKNARDIGRPDPIPLSLNEYGDCSAIEYKTIQTKDPSMSASTSAPAIGSTLPFNAYSSESAQEQERIRQIYQEWSVANGKSFDESRLDIFAFNLKVVENYYKKTGTKAELNRYADLSPEEYKAATEDAQSETATPFFFTGQQQQQQRDSSEQERIINAYRDWCNENGREYQESRFEIFATNLNAVEKYRRETGKIVKLNKYADLSPDEYSLVIAGESANSGIANATTTTPTSATTMANNPMSSYLENLTPSSTQISLKVEDRIRNIYIDWCQYYGKGPDEDRLQIFAANLVVLEKHHSETGEELTLNEFADQTQGVGSKSEASQVEEAKRLEEARLEQERVEQARLEQERTEQARLETERIQREEQDRLEREQREAEERTRNEQERMRQMEKERLQTEQRMLEEQRLEQERQSSAASFNSYPQTIVDEEAFMKPDRESSFEQESVSKTIEDTTEESDDDKGKSNSIALPRSSYMDAVARTWVDRSAYLESLQQGKTGVLPEPPSNKSPWEEESVERNSSKPSTSLVNSIWEFINDSRRSASEQYAKRLIIQADEMIADAETSSNFDDSELRHLREAVNALRRRKRDEQGAEKARTEAKEWEEIQKGLEKEATLAKERRQYEEKVAAEAREKARLFESQGDVEKTTNFSFIPNPFQGAEEGSSFTPSFPSIPAAEINIFSFLGGNNDEQRSQRPKSLTQPVVMEKKESWLTFLFDFFGAYRQPEEPGLGTITLAPAKRTTVFDFFVSPEMFAPTQPGRGSITVDEPKKPSIFSFFANFGTRKGLQEIDPRRRRRVEEYENRQRSRQAKISWLEAERSRILEETDKNLSRKEARRLQKELDALAAGNSTTVNMDPNIPLLAKWTKTPDGRITGFVAETSRKFKMGTKITTSRIKGQTVKAGVIVTTISGSQYRLGLPLSLASEGSRRADGSQMNPEEQRVAVPPFRFPFGGLFGDQDVPSLVEWVQNDDGTITGFVNNKIGFEDGTQITTSPVNLGVRSGMTVETRGGSKYKLLKEKRY